MSEKNQSTPRRWVRALLTNGALGIFSILLALGAAELAIRIAAPQQLILIRPDLWQAVDTVGWAAPSSLDLRASSDSGIATSGSRSVMPSRCTAAPPCF